LPTEAEWEYAARGGNKSQGFKYTGSQDLYTVAWFEDNSGGQTNSIGRKKPNELGLYDMSGNVWEWCRDWYDYDYYKNSPTTNPRGPSSGSARLGFAV
jgi:formylglycine-generating enzyme